MRKLFMFLAVTAFVTFGTSCSKDEKTEKSENKKLELKADVSEIKVGETVTFTVSDGKANVADAKITGNKGAVVKENKFTPTKVGKYSFKARKKDFKESNAVEITVTADSETPAGETPANETPAGEKVTALAVTIEGANFKKEGEFYIIEAYKPVSFKVVDSSNKPVVGAKPFFGTVDFSNYFNDLKNGEYELKTFVPGGFKLSLHFEKDGVKSNILNNMFVLVSDKKIKTGNFEFDLDYAEFSYAATDDKGDTPYVVENEGKKYFYWRLKLNSKRAYREEVAGQQYTFPFNFVIAEFFTECKLDNNNKPIFDKDSEIIFSPPTVSIAELGDPKKYNYVGFVFKSLDFVNNNIDVDFAYSTDVPKGNIFEVYVYFKGDFIRSHFKHNPQPAPAPAPAARALRL